MRGERLGPALIREIYLAEKGSLCVSGTGAGPGRWLAARQQMARQTAVTLDGRLLAPMKGTGP